jgi:hypothetical protein
VTYFVIFSVEFCILLRVEKSTFIIFLNLFR